MANGVCWGHSRLDFYWHQPDRSAFTHPSEVHRTWVILTADEGDFSFEFASHKGQCAPGEFIVCPPGLELRRRALGILTYHVLLFSWEQVHSSGQEREDDGLAEPLIGKFAARDLVRFQSDLGYLRNLSTRHDVEAMRWKNHLLADLLHGAAFEQAEAARARARKPPPDRLMEKASRQLASGLAEELRLGVLARELGLNAVTFSRRFRTALGVSPSHYLASLRLQKARRLLLDTDLTMEAIAALTGYGSAFYFSRAFTRCIGLNPSKFRRRSRL